MFATRELVEKLNQTQLKLCPYCVEAILPDQSVSESKYFGKTIKVHDKCAKR